MSASRPWRISERGYMNTFTVTGPCSEPSSFTLASVSVLRLPAVQSASSVYLFDSQPTMASTPRNSTAVVSCWMRTCLRPMSAALQVEALHGQPQEQRREQDVVGDVGGAEHAAAQVVEMPDQRQVAEQVGERDLLVGQDLHQPHDQQ